ncbi:MAG: NAD(P)/FAD-dependent oxidoreductase [Planctomycetia bacterium]|nr:NAD(P)/FAD-dependent oxidoreductase [Planctomycetia bacterium]
MKKDTYDIVVIGAGLGGMTAANVLARNGFRVLLCEFHHQLGGLATWFRRKEGVIFDVSLHGFPVGMIKSCRRYWTKEIADSIVQLPSIRFDNPMFTLDTTFNREDFTRLLVERFGVEQERVEAFFNKARSMTFVDDQSLTTQELFEEFFPGRDDIVRLLMEPITYANGSTLEDPAITYGIVFSNFMSKGVFTFRGGTDRLVALMEAEMLRNGVEIATRTRIDRILTENGRVAGVVVEGREIRTKAVVSNSNLKSTIFNMVGEEHFSEDFLAEAKKVRLNNSSTQVYLSLKPGETIDESRCGDLLFTSTAEKFDTQKLLSRDITSRTYSFYYPKTRPGVERYAVVASTNANYSDWANLTPEAYESSKKSLIEETLDALEKYVPGIRTKIDWAEAATPCTFERYTLHQQGASFGTKFEGLAISRSLPEQIGGLFHTGSVGIIMSGWLGAVNYGVIVANDVDAFVRK